MKFAGYAPNLVLTLSRFKVEDDKYTKNNITVKYPLRLQLPCFHYSLYGVVYHHGDMDYGHYLSVCKNPLNKKWYRFDDHFVAEITEMEALSAPDAYILFYQLIE